MNDPLANAYRSPEAADEYGARHQNRRIRRWVSRRESGIAARMLAKLPAGALLIDAPCGTGRHTAFLRNAGWRAIGVDASSDMIRQGLVRESLHPGAAAVASIFQLPFLDDSFAGCACLRFFHHLPGHDARRDVLSELRRVVKGPVVLSLWTGFNLQWGRRALKRRLGRRPSARYATRLGPFYQELAQMGYAVKKRRFLFRFVSETVYLLLVPKEME